MTLFGIDVSNHQRVFDFAQARREGYSFATHKVNEGTWLDPYWPKNRDALAAAFPDTHAGYVFCKVGTNPEAEADAYFAHGGTRTVQIDYEDLDRNGSIEDLLRRVNAFLERGARLLPVYIPRWYWASRMGRPDLSMLRDVGIWNSHYVKGEGFGSQLYPGDDWTAEWSRGEAGGWADFPGAPVRILQFSELATVAGRKPIDVNGFRGSEEELAALFGAVTAPPTEGFDMSEAQKVVDQLTGPEGKGWPILGKAVETAPDRDRYLVEAVAQVLVQLGGPLKDGQSFKGWPQLGDGPGSEMPERTLVDGIAYVKGQNDEILSLLRGLAK